MECPAWLTCFRPRNQDLEKVNLPKAGWRFGCPWAHALGVAASRAVVLRAREWRRR